MIRADVAQPLPRGSFGAPPSLLAKALLFWFGASPALGLLQVARLSQRSELSPATEKPRGSRRPGWVLGHGCRRGRTVNYSSDIVPWVLTGSASSLGSAGTWSLGELCPGRGMPCSSYLQEPWEFKWKVNAASSALVLCQQFKVSYCTGFQMEVQGFSVSIFSLLRLNLRKESIHL